MDRRTQGGASGYNSATVSLGLSGSEGEPDSFSIDADAVFVHHNVASPPAHAANSHGMQLTNATFVPIRPMPTLPQLEILVESEDRPKDDRGVNVESSHDTHTHEHAHAQGHVSTHWLSPIQEASGVFGTEHRGTATTLAPASAKHNRKSTSRTSSAASIGTTSVSSQHSHASSLQPPSAMKGKKKSYRLSFDFFGRHHGE
jgi:hypothetical protein